MVQIPPPTHTRTHPPFPELLLCIQRGGECHLLYLRISLPPPRRGGESGESSGYKDNDGTFGREDVTEAACPWGLVQVPFVAAILPWMGGWEEGTGSFRVQKSLETD